MLSPIGPQKLRRLPKILTETQEDIYGLDSIDVKTQNLDVQRKNRFKSGKMREESSSQERLFPGIKKKQNYSTLRPVSKINNS